MSIIIMMNICIVGIGVGWAFSISSTGGAMIFARQWTVCRSVLGCWESLGLEDLQFDAMEL
jgi:subtilase family serine protease